MTETTQTYFKVARVVAEVFMINQNDLTPQSSANDVAGWDSVSQVALIMRIEEELGVDLDLADANAFANLEELAELVDVRKRAGSTIVVGKATR
jgi:acyl carrier protein